jgi:hypothetical protein
VASTLDFGEAVTDWVIRTQDELEAVFKMSFEMLRDNIVENTPIKTGFLRNSITVTIGGPAMVDPAAKKNGDYRAPVHEAVIASAKLGDTLSLGFVAAYARRIEYGFEGTDSLGREYHQTGRAMVRLGVQRFPEFILAAVRQAEANRSPGLFQFFHSEDD